MRVVRAQQEQHDRDAQQKLFRWRILVPIIDLLPHVEVIVGAGVELEWHATDPVEHQVGTEHVGYVGECPGGLLRYAWHYVEEDFEAADYYDVDGPGAYK